MLNITGDIQKNIYSLISFKIDSVLSLFMLALKLLIYFSLYQYQNLGVNLEKLYNVMVDLACDLQVRYKK